MKDKYISTIYNIKLIDKFYEKFIGKSSFLNNPMVKDPNEINLKHIIKSKDKVKDKVDRSEINLNELGILLINMIPKYIDGLEIAKRNLLLSYTKDILNLSEKKNYPIIQVNNPNYKTYGTKLSALGEILSDATKHVPIESTNSPFSNTYFMPQLDSWNIKQLLIIGIGFNLLEQIAIDANNKHYQVIIVPELVVDHDLAKDKSDYTQLVQSPGMLGTNALFVKNLEYISAIMAKKKEPKWKKPVVTTNKGKLYK